MIDLTADTQAIAGAIAMQVSGAHVVGVVVPQYAELAHVVLDDAEIRMAPEDTLVVLRRRSGERDLQFAARLALHTLEATK